jgi:hypothetical protein
MLREPRTKTKHAIGAKAESESESILDFHGKQRSLTLGSWGDAVGIPVRDRVTYLFALKFVKLELVTTNNAFMDNSGLLLPRALESDPELYGDLSKILLVRRHCNIHNRRTDGLELAESRRLAYSHFLRCVAFASPFIC